MAPQFAKSAPLLSLTNVPLPGGLRSERRLIVSQKDALVVIGIAALALQALSAYWQYQQLQVARQV
jgi:hypothetical protein